MAIQNKYVRQEIIDQLKNDLGVTALVPAQRIYPQQVVARPTWPYCYTGAPVTTRFDATCLRGQVVSLAIHGYAMGESLADDIADAVRCALDQRHLRLFLADDAYMNINWISNSTIRDPSEADAFHSICQIECFVVS